MWLSIEFQNFFVVEENDMHISVGISQIHTIDQLFIYCSRVNERILRLLVAVNNNCTVSASWFEVWPVRGVGALWSETGWGGG